MIRIRKLLRTINKLTALLLFAGFLLFVPNNLAFASINQYLLIDLGDLPGGDDWSKGEFINNAGQVAGRSDTALVNDNYGVHAFIWDIISGKTDIDGALENVYTADIGINNHGDIVGAYWDGGPSKAFTWDVTNGKQVLTVPGFLSYYGAYDINDNGNILAINWNSNASQGSTYLLRSGVWTTIPALETTPGNLYGTAINNHDQIVGYGRVGGVGFTTSFQAFVWNDVDGTRPLPTLGGTQSIARSINESGQIVGWASAADGTQHAVLWSDGTVTDLSDLGARTSQASGINESGDVVGYQTWEADSIQHAFLYSQGEILYLNDLIDSSIGWTLKYAWDINDNGWITGEGIDANGNTHGYVLIPYVSNQPPTADPNGPYLGPVAPDSISFNGSDSSDPDGDSLNFDWDWGDGSASLDAGPTPDHSYTNAGIYDVCLTVFDGTLSDTACTYVVVFDPNGGFVTGGGWIFSPAGAFTLNEDLDGFASFGFVSKYLKGKVIPEGETEFHFNTASGLKFHSTAYEWLVVAPEYRARFQGHGTVWVNENMLGDVGDSRFVLTTIDGDLDGTGEEKLRMRIWNDADGVIYDNEIDVEDGEDPTTVLESGSVIIHTTNWNTK